MTPLRRRGEEFWLHPLWQNLVGGCQSCWSLWLESVSLSENLLPLKLPEYEKKLYIIELQFEHKGKDFFFTILGQECIQDYKIWRKVVNKSSRFADFQKFKNKYLCTHHVCLGLGHTRKCGWPWSLTCNDLGGMGLMLRSWGKHCLLGDGFWGAEVFVRQTALQIVREVSRGPVFCRCEIKKFFWKMMLTIFSVSWIESVITVYIPHLVFQKISGAYPETVLKC